jgi:small subunit ribosomal protein S2
MAQDITNTVSIKSLLEAGAHFGHPVGHWHPKMKRYIFTQRNGIHIIDLEQTLALLEKAAKFIAETASAGGEVLFVSTKRQAQEIIEQEAKRCGMPFVSQRWIGGTLTNFIPIQSRIDYLVRLEDQKSRGELAHLPKKDAIKLEKTIQRLNRKIGGLKEMTRLPAALFIIDPSKEKIAVAEGRRLAIPLVSVVDTNCNPDEIDYPIPANDDAVRAIKLICSRIAEAVLEGKKLGEEAGEAVEGMTQEEAVEAFGSLTFAPEEGEPPSEQTVESLEADILTNESGLEEGGENVQPDRENQGAKE